MRGPLVEGPMYQTPFVASLARVYPKVLSAAVVDLGFDSYQNNIARPPSGTNNNAGKGSTDFRHFPLVDAVAIEELEHDGGSLALTGWYQASPSEGDLLWVGVKQDGSTVDVDCMVVGIPRLLASAQQVDVFKEFVQTNNLELLQSDAMRAAIAFKWQAFGKRAWLMQVAIFFAFFVCFVGGTSLLIHIETEELRRLGLAMYVCAALMCLYFLHIEFLELIAARAQYFRSVTNWIDVTLPALVLLLAPSLCYQVDDSVSIVAP